MTSMRGAAWRHADSTVIVAHPGAEMYGSDRVMLDSVIGLIAAGKRVIVTLPAEGPLVAHLREAGAIVVVSPTFVLRKRLMKPSGWIELFRTAWAGGVSVWRMLGTLRPAAVYVSTITLPFWPVLARMRRIPVVLHIHEGEAAASTLMKKVLYAPARCARVVLVNSEFSLSVLASAYPRLRGRAVVVPNAVEGPALPTPPRERLEGRLRVLYLGRLSPRKGVDLVVEAVAMLAQEGIDVSADIVGSAFEGYEPYVADLRATIATHGMDARVRLHGFQTDIWAFLDDTDVLVVPSRHDEGFGNTAVEGLLARRPVVVSDTSGLREATEGMPSSIRVVPDSAASVADALRRMVAEWPAMRAGTVESHRLAAERHAPEAYRRRVADYVDAAAAVAAFSPRPR